MISFHCQNIQDVNPHHHIYTVNPTLRDCLLALVLVDYDWTEEDAGVFGNVFLINSIAYKPIIESTSMHDHTTEFQNKHTPKPPCDYIPNKSEATLTCLNHQVSRLNIINRNDVVAPVVEVQGQKEHDPYGDDSLFSPTPDQEHEPVPATPEETEGTVARQPSDRLRRGNTGLNIPVIPTYMSIQWEYQNTLHNET